jgi:hypothetical protein
MVVVLELNIEFGDILISSPQPFTSSLCTHWYMGTTSSPCTILVIGSDVVGNAVLLSRIHHMFLPLPYHAVRRPKRQG